MRDEVEAEGYIEKAESSETDVGRNDQVRPNEPAQPQHAVALMCMGRTGHKVGLAITSLTYLCHALLQRSLLLTRASRNFP